jgi:hypothetical protein
LFWRVQADMLAARLDSANGGEIPSGVGLDLRGESSVGSRSGWTWFWKA